MGGGLRRRIPEEPPTGPDTAPVPVIAQRVEALRGLAFDRVPEPVSVTPEQAQREGLEDLDRSYPEARRRTGKRSSSCWG